MYNWTECLEVHMLVWCVLPSDISGMVSCDVHVMFITVDGGTHDTVCAWIYKTGIQVCGAGFSHYMAAPANVGQNCRKTYSKNNL